MRAIAQMVVEREEYEPQAPSAVVRICKTCGKHHVGLMRWKAGQEAEKLCREALAALRKDDHQRFQALQTDAAVVIDSAEGICRACSVARHWKEK